MRSPRAHVGVNRLVTVTARKYGVTIYDYANVGNHLHAVIRLKAHRHRPYTRLVSG